MGKTKDPIWSYFDIIPLPQPAPKPPLEKVLCKYCPWSLSFKNATRATNHILNSCQSCPDVVKSAVRTLHPKAPSNGPSPKLFVEQIHNRAAEEMADDVSPISSPTPSNCSAGSSNSLLIESPLSPPSPAASSSHRTGSPATFKSPSILNFMDHMSASDQADSQAAFARAVFATSCPLSLFEHPLWQEAFRKIRPAFKPPKSNLLGGKLLDQEYNIVMSACKKKINSAQVLGVTSDGWKNIRGEGLLNFVLLTPDPVFIKAVELKDQKEDATFIANELESVIEEVGPEKVCSVITDSAAYNKAAWEKITTRYPHISAVGDPAHALDLLMEDCLSFKSLQKVNKMSKVLYKGIRLHRRPFGFFQKEQERIYGSKSQSLKLMSITRFAGTVIFFESLQANKSVLQSTVLAATSHQNPTNEEERLKFYVPAKVRDVALDENYFWPKLAEWLSVLKPIAMSIALMESDSVLMSDVPEAFYSILLESVKAMQDSARLKRLVPSFKRLILKRKDFVCKPVHFAANLLDPRYRGVHLTRDEKLEAAAHISEMCGCLQMTDEGKKAVLSNLTEFRSETGIWAEESVKESYRGVAPVAWWRANCKDEPLYPIAIRLLTVPPTSCSTERVWSAYGRNHTKGRNRLKNKKTEKLVAVQLNLRYAVPAHMIPKSQTKKRSEKGALFPGNFEAGDDIIVSEALETDNSTDEDDYFSESDSEDQEGSDLDWNALSTDEASENEDEEMRAATPELPATAEAPPPPPSNATAETQPPPLSTRTSSRIRQNNKRRRH